MTDTTIRNTGLRHILGTRRREMQDDVHGRIRERCTGQPTEARDTIEHADAGFHEEMELALLQMRSDMLIRVDEALLRLDAGEYGSCSECAGEISERRLRALPFAVRCQACEEKREQALAHTRHTIQLHGDFSLVPEMTGL
jgi:DnaK suppressor protein